MAPFKYPSCLIILVLSYAVAADKCLSPDVKFQSYTTTDATVVSNIGFIAEFTFTCANNVQNINLHAEIGGKLLPVTKSQEGNKYQVSWTEDVAKASSGDYPVRVYDEDGYSSLRKAQRSGEEISTVEPLFMLTVNHSGTYSGPWVQSELLAAVVSLLVWYFAYSTKSKLQA